MNSKQENVWGKKEIFVLGILAVLVLCAIGALIFRKQEELGKRVVVTLDGNVIYEGDLQREIEIPIRSKNGVNVIATGGGTVSVVEADCPDQICVEHVEINQVGDTIVCLPHKLVLEIER